MRYAVILLAEARDDAVEAARYIAEHSSLESATRWYEALDAAGKSLKSMPARFGYARENGVVPHVELRQVVFLAHRLIYTIRGRQVHILHVRHVARATLSREELNETMRDVRD